MVSGITDYEKFYVNITQGVKTEFSIKIMNNEIYKINVVSANDYRAKSLNNSNIPCYSYENKQSRPIKIIIKNLHHAWSPAEIMSDLNKQQFKVLAVIN